MPTHAKPRKIKKRAQEFHSQERNQQLRAAAEQKRFASLFREDDHATADPTEFLRKMGVDVKELKANTRRERQALIARADQFRKTPPRWFPDPAPPQDTPDLEQPGITQPVGGWPLSGNCSLGLADHFMRLRGRTTGGGGAWGWFATIRPPSGYTYLRFVYVPAQSGFIFVWTSVRVSGVYTVQYHPHWYTNTGVELKVDVFTEVLGTGGSYTRANRAVLDIHNRAEAAWIDQTYYFPAMFIPVSAAEAVTIDVGAVVFADAHSDHALVDFDFCTDDNHFWAPSPAVAPWTPGDDGPIL